MNKVSLNFELKYRDLGYKYIIGVDEAGAGCLAGPLVVAAVHIPEGFDITGIKDSKKLTPKKREEMASRLMNNCEFRIVEINEKLIDEINIRNARMVGMGHVINQIEEADLALIDGDFIPEFIDVHAVPIINGDNLSASIAAASIIAKVHRDSLMMTFHKKYPVYGWDKNKGYGTQQHRDALKEYGPSPLHRKSFKGVLQ